MKRINSSSGVRERQRDHTGRNKMTQDEHSLSLSQNSQGRPNVYVYALPDNSRPPWGEVVTYACVFRKACSQPYLSSEA